MNYCKHYKCTIPKKQSLKMFTQITYRTNFIKLISVKLQVYMSYNFQALWILLMRVSKLQHYHISKVFFISIFCITLLYYPHLNNDHQTTRLIKLPFPYVSAVKIINHAILPSITLPLKSYSDGKTLGSESIHTYKCYAFHRFKILSK